MYSGLGIAPAVAALVIQQAPAILSDIDKLFGDTGSYDQTHAAILQEVQLILSDPAAAVSGNYVHANSGLASPANAYLWLNCQAGNEAVLATYRQVSGDPASNGCGFETAYGGRADAQNALARVNQALNQPAPVVSSAPIPSAPGGGYTPANNATVVTTLPGGIQIGLPVPASTITQSTILGVPILGWVGGIALLAFASGRRGRA